MSTEPTAEFDTEGPAVTEFLARFCRHPRGTDVGRPVLLAPEQQHALNGMLRLNDEGKWQHREALIMVHRKWAKTLIGSGLSLYTLLSRPMGTEVYFAANSRSQASILKRNVDAFALSTAALRKRLYVFKNKIETPLGSYMLPLGADAHQAHGYNPYLSLIDEYWAFKDNTLPEALSSGSAARDESLTIYITTPGINKDSPLGRVVERALRGDPSLYVYWPGRDMDDDIDIFDEEAWAQYNIGFRRGWISKTFLQSQAQSLPRDEFIRLHLGGWASRSAGWMDMKKWDVLEDNAPLEDNTPMVVFIDGAWKHDSMAMIGVTIEDVPKIHALAIWEKPIGNEMWRVPYNDLDAKMRDIVDRYRVRQIGCDPFFLGQLMQQWADSGFPVLEIPTNSVGRAVSATKRFEDALIEGRFKHDGNPVMRRHLQNCVPKRDRYGLRVVRDRGNPVGFIDAGVGAIFGYDMASKEQQESTLWMY